MATESRIQIDKLDNQNWGIWRRKFKALLFSKRLGGVIDGTDEDKDNSSQVLGLTQLHLSDAYLSMADDVATAKALWDKLEATFHCTERQTPSAQTGAEQPQEGTNRVDCRICRVSQGACYQPGSSRAQARTLRGLTVTTGRPSKGVQRAGHHPGDTQADADPR